MNNKKLNAVDAIRHAINVIQQQSQSIKADETLAVLSMLNKESQRISSVRLGFCTSSPALACF